MNDWARRQEVEIARRVLAERDAGRAVDPSRLAWAERVLRDGRAEQPQPETAS